MIQGNRTPIDIDKIKKLFKDHTQIIVDLSCTKINNFKISGIVSRVVNKFEKKFPAVNITCL